MSGNYVLNKITHERNVNEDKETQHLKSRKFNKFMSIIILNDSIILECCVYAFQNWKL